MSIDYYPDEILFSLDGVVNFVEYPEFFWWRFEQVFGKSEEFLEITPDMVDGYFKEPEDPMQTRCPRCFSTRVDIGYPHITCKDCGYNEPLIDFPISHYFHLAMLKETGNRTAVRGQA